MTRIYFPVRATKSEFDKHFVVKNLEPDLVTVLEELQPFKVLPERPTHEALWVLHQLAMLDRHRGRKRRRPCGAGEHRAGVAGNGREP